MPVVSKEVVESGEPVAIPSDIRENDRVSLKLLSEFTSVLVKIM